MELGHLIFVEFGAGYFCEWLLQRSRNFPMNSNMELHISEDTESSRGSPATLTLNPKPYMEARLSPGDFNAQRVQVNNN